MCCTLKEQRVQLISEMIILVVTSKGNTLDAGINYLLNILITVVMPCVCCHMLHKGHLHLQASPALYMKPLESYQTSARSFNLRPIHWPLIHWNR